MSLDAWHDPFRLDGSTSGVYVEVSFKGGRVGGDSPEIPFTFKLSLKRALLTIQLESPLEIERRSVARSIPSTAAELSSILKTKERAEISLGGKAKISPASFHLALSGESKSTDEVSREDEIKVIQTLPQIIVSPRPVSSRSYSWHLESSYNPSLQGQPWHPADEPRFRIKAIDNIQKIFPTIKVVVSCALEDIIIEDIKLKSDGLGQSIKNIIFNNINEAAAIQHLKLVLKNSDLEPSAMDNRFSDLIIANVLAMSE
jgi:hypothetical protein